MRRTRQKRAWLPLLVVAGLTTASVALIGVPHQDETFTVDELATTRMMGDQLASLMGQVTISSANCDVARGQVSALLEKINLLNEKLVTVDDPDAQSARDVADLSAGAQWIDYHCSHPADTSSVQSG